MKKVYKKILRDNNLFTTKLQTSAFGKRLKLNQGDLDTALKEFEILIDEPTSLLYSILKFN